MISAEKHNIVYFTGGEGSNHVNKLNATSHECEAIKLLTFVPRCLVAENGWVCCGGEEGQFTAIQLETSNNGNEFDVCIDPMDPETSLPLDSDSPRPSDDAVLSILVRARLSSKSQIAKSMKLARDRVNCIALWFPPQSLPTCDGAYTEPVAVLANNDGTVIMVSLSDFDSNDKTEPLDVIDYPDCVNRAIISPDGRFLIAILDDPFLYIHRRTERHPDETRSFKSRDNVSYEWELCSRIWLKSQRRDDDSDNRGSFAACFNSSGRYLAVGAQYGTISIFDTTAFNSPEMDPLIMSFKSSRPETNPGAVRDMAFSPGPFDLLAWTEHGDHVGVTDLQSNFATRQILDIWDSLYRHDSLHESLPHPKTTTGLSWSEDGCIL